MSRKRSRTPRKQIVDKKTKISKEIKIPKLRLNKNKGKYMTFFILISIFCLVLFFNSYFNYTSGIAHNPDGTTLGTRFYLAGPDPYYNMRLCEETLETGHYPFIGSEADPMLNYPLTKPNAGRPPLFNMIAVGVAQFGSNFMSQTDALGWAMLFLPAIYGALLIFPIYGIGKELFNKKVGIIAALFISIIPVHIGAGHGSSFSLFDHDSFLLLLMTFVIYFLIKSLKEKDNKKAIFYAILSGVFIGAVELTWVAAEYIFMLIMIFIITQLFIDIIRSNIKNILNKCLPAISLCTGILISFPYIILKENITTSVPFYIVIASLAVCFIYYIIKKLDFPWILSLPSMLILSGIGLSFFYFIHIGLLKIGGFFPRISNIIFGESGVYGSKNVILTIAEVHTYSLSATVMSIGPILYWVGMAGFLLFVINTHKEKWKPENVLFLVWFIVSMWLLSNAGRFINDLIPTITVFAAFCIYYIIKKIDYKTMIKNMRNVAGLRKIKVINITQICGILFIIFLIVPNSFCALDAAVPPSMKSEVFGEDHKGSWGTGLGQQYYWSDACYWLSQQDTEIEDPAKRPAFISWWDYGFYVSSMSGHPTVADNFQDGIEPAGNFHTAKTEKEAVSVLIIRIIAGVQFNKEKITDDIKLIFNKYLNNDSIKLIDILENGGESYKKIILPEYGNTILQVSWENAKYHDACKIMSNLSDEEITMFYHDIMEVTGYSIRYYGVESYDTQIFGVFSFLSSKGTHGYSTYEDDYFVTKYMDSITGKRYTIKELENISQQEMSEMNLNPTVEKKEAFYNTMFYKTFYGINSDGSNRIPTIGLKHFVPVYFSHQVIIAKYYEGAKINGTVYINNTNIPYIGAQIYVLDELLGIPHDMTNVDINGNFNVIVPAGNITLKLFIGENELDEIIFNTENNPPITEDEAMRFIESNRTVSFNIDMASLDVSVNTNQTNLTIKLEGLNTFVEKSIKISDELNIIENLLPDLYKISLVNETGVEVYTENKFLHPNEITKLTIEIK